MTGPEIAQRAKEQVAQLTGLKPDTVSALYKAADGWHVTLDMIELKRIPDASDVLAAYEVLLDDEGNVTGYHRARRYYRGDVSWQET
jgi:hypothetical protein